MVAKLNNDAIFSDFI